MMGDGNESEAEALEERLGSNLTHAILERIVYKNKNQHRRSAYFLYLLKVRRDLKLLQTARPEDLTSSCFQVIIGDKPKQRIYHLESLKNGVSDGGKPNFMESLSGAAHLLAEMVEPMLKAACEISILLARSFFIVFSLTVLALLARLRILVQQILLDLVSAFNMVSSISQEKRSANLTREGIEVVRECYPLKRDSLTLECDWATNKFVLLEKTCRIEDGQMKESGGDVLAIATEVQCHSIKCLLEASIFLSNPETVDDLLLRQMNRYLLSSLRNPKSVGIDLFQTESHAGLLSGAPKGKTDTKRVAFVSVKRPSLSASEDSGKLKAKRTCPELPAGSDDPFF